MSFIEEKEYDEVSGTIITATAKAVLIEVTGSGNEVWIPRSLLHEDEIDIGEENYGENAVLLVESWFVDKEGL